MFATIEVLIGLSLVYLLLALIVSAITEWWSSLFGMRAKNLRTAVRQMLDGLSGSELTDRFFTHPRIVALSRGRKLPSYIPAKTFVDVVMDLAKDKDMAAKMPILAGDAPSPDELEFRFLDTMNRASGWYKRSAIVLAVILSAVVVIAANADTVDIVERLWASPSLRAAAVAQAERRVAMGRPRPLVTAEYENPNNPIPTEEDESAEGDADVNRLTAEDRQALDSLLGWSTEYLRINRPYCERREEERDTACLPEDNDAACEKVMASILADERCEVKSGALEPTNRHPGSVVLASSMAGAVFNHLFGWLLSIAAVSLGAPFWFDTLSRFVNLRGAGPVERPKNKGDSQSTNVEAGR